MSLRILTFVGGPAETNAFLVEDVESKRALVIDAPMDVTEEIVAAAASDGVTIERIVITHTHWDHIRDAAGMKRETNALLVAHPLAVEPLAFPSSPSGYPEINIEPSKADELVGEGDTV